MTFCEALMADRLKKWAIDVFPRRHKPNFGGVFKGRTFEQKELTLFDSNARLTGHDNH